MDRHFTRTALALALLLPSLSTSIANVALPAIALDFHAPFQEVQRVVVAYLGAVSVSVVLVGRLGDRAGRTRLLIGGIVVFAFATACAGAAPTLGALTAARTLQGVGAAVLLAMAVAVVGDIVPKEQTGRVMGLLGTTSAVGTALGPAAGGALTAAFGWRAVFFAQVPAALIALLLALRFLPASAPRVSSPLSWSRPLRDPHLRANLAMSALVAAVLMTTLVVGPFYLARALGLAAGAVGAAMAVGPVVAALTAGPAGRVVDHYGPGPATTGGLVAIAVGTALLASAPGGTLGYVAPLAVLTAGYALFQTANQTASLREVQPSERGVVSGFLTLSRNLGLAAGAWAMGAVFAAAAGGDVASAPAADVSDGMRAAFAVGTGVVVVALGIRLRAR